MIKDTITNNHEFSVAVNQKNLIQKFELYKSSRWYKGKLMSQLGLFDSRGPWHSRIRVCWSEVAAVGFSPHDERPQVAKEGRNGEQEEGPPGRETPTLRDHTPAAKHPPSRQQRMSQSGSGFVHVLYSFRTILRLFKANFQGFVVKKPIFEETDQFFGNNPGFGC